MIAPGEIAIATNRPSSEDQSDPAADFGAWVAPHLPALAALAIRQVGHAHAADVLQNTLERAWRRRSTYRAERGSPRTWLVAILLDRARRHRARSRPPAAELTDEFAAPLIEQDLGLSEAIDRLPERQRQAVMLYYLADLPVAEVAAVLGVSPGTIKSQLSDARRNLARTLRETDDD